MWEGAEETRSRITGSGHLWNRATRTTVNIRCALGRNALQWNSKVCTLLEQRRREQLTETKNGLDHNQKKPTELKCKDTWNIVRNHLHQPDHNTWKPKNVTPLFKEHWLIVDCYSLVKSPVSDKQIKHQLMLSNFSSSLMHEPIEFKTFVPVLAQIRDGLRP